MLDIALIGTRTDFGDVFDLGLFQNDFTGEDGFRTAVTISLFTDMRVTKDEIDSGQSQRGWWGDVISDITADQIGSKLWLLDRQKQTEDTRIQAEEYASTALQWMIDGEIAESVSVTASYPTRGILFIEVFIQKPNGEKLNYAFDNAWKAEGAR